MASLAAEKAEAQIQSSGQVATVVACLEADPVTDRTSYAAVWSVKGRRAAVNQPNADAVGSASCRVYPAVVDP
jgi:hypothetical protein